MGAKFCFQCGSSLAESLICPNCHFDNRVEPIPQNLSAEIPLTSMPMPHGESPMGLKNIWGNRIVQVVAVILIMAFGVIYFLYGGQTPEKQIKAFLQAVDQKDVSKLQKIVVSDANITEDDLKNYVAYLGNDRSKVSSYTGSDAVNQLIRYGGKKLYLFDQYKVFIPSTELHIQTDMDATLTINGKQYTTTGGQDTMIARFLPGTYKIQSKYKTLLGDISGKESNATLSNNTVQNNTYTMELNLGDQVIGYNENMDGFNQIAKILNAYNAASIEVDKQYNTSLFTPYLYPDSPAFDYYLSGEYQQMLDELKRDNFTRKLKYLSLEMDTNSMSFIDKNDVVVVCREKYNSSEWYSPNNPEEPTDETLIWSYEFRMDGDKLKIYSCYSDDENSERNWVDFTGK